MHTVLCHDKDGQTQEVPVSELSFRPSIYGVLIEDGKVLLSKQYDGYDFPGGGVDVGERLLDALKREVKEETGLSVTPGEQLLVTDDFFLATRGRKMHSILIFYTCHSPVGEISTEGFDEYEKEYADKAEWVQIEVALKAKFYNPIDSPALILKAASLIESSR